MKTTLTDLNNHLFEQLERLNDTDLSGDKLHEEIARAKAISQVATQIVNNSKTVLGAMKLKANDDANPAAVDKMLGNGEK